MQTTEWPQLLIWLKQANQIAGLLPCCSRNYTCHLGRYLSAFQYCSFPTKELGLRIFFPHLQISIMFHKNFQQLIAYIRGPKQSLLALKIGSGAFFIPYLIYQTISLLGFGNIEVIKNIVLLLSFMGLACMALVGIIREEFGQGMKMYTGKPAVLMAYIFFVLTSAIACYVISRIVVILTKGL